MWWNQDWICACGGRSVRKPSLFVLAAIGSVLFWLPQDSVAADPRYDPNTGEIVESRAAAFKNAVANSWHEQYADQPDADAGLLYEAATDMIIADSTVNGEDQSQSLLPGPPYSALPLRITALEFRATKHVRDLVHKARSIKSANWRIHSGREVPLFRTLTFYLGEDANYADYLGEHAYSIEIARDLLHMADLMQFQPYRFFNVIMAGVGIRRVALYRLEVAVAGSPLTEDASDSHDLRVSTARDLITELLQQTDAAQQLVGMHFPFGVPSPGDPHWADRQIEQINRVNADSTFDALSLACHLFQYDHGRWPKSLDELVPKYIKQVPIDPWGDGKQTFAYALIKGGLPDGSDRPLLYDRDEGTDRLFYQLDRPAFEFERNEWKASNRSKHGGQFRDVARWSPPANGIPPATQPLP
jgi:hypothetical protein